MMLRANFGPVVGCGAAFAVIMAVEMAGSTLFPLPADITPSKMPG
jgi:hypothetical protein